MSPKLRPVRSHARETWKVILQVIVLRVVAKTKQYILQRIHYQWKFKRVEKGYMSSLSRRRCRAYIDLPRQRSFGRLVKT